MAIKILMPALSPTMSKGTLARWLKKEGDSIAPGEVIAEIESDKATMEVEALDKGTLAKILIHDNSPNIDVNLPIAILKEKNDTDSDIEKLIAECQNAKNCTNNAIIGDSSQNNTLKDNSSINLMTSAQEADNHGTKRFSTPLARKVAKELNINIANIKHGSGPNGRILRADIIEAQGNLANQKSPPHINNLSSPQNKRNDSIQHINQPSNLREIRDLNIARLEDSILPISNMRKVIAERLCQSKQEIPHFYLEIQCNVKNMMELRKNINDIYEKESKATSSVALKISVNDMIVKAVSLAMANNTGINVSWNSTHIVQYNNIDISIAVALTDGLITPIIKQANHKSLAQISLATKELIQKANQNQLRTSDIQGGGITISNLGMYGIPKFNAIINPPQASILAVGAAINTPVISNGQIQIEPVINLTLSCDHRAIDGAIAAQFLANIKDLIENPLKLLM